MNQVQFNTIIDGDVIRIPDEYKRRFPNQVTIVITEVQQKRRWTPEDFTELSISEVYKFDREEANERR
jgi:hypothetical protein